MTTTDHFSVGSRVVTRRGKKGTVIAVNGPAVTVAFWPGHEGLELRETQLVTERAYESMARGRPVPGQAVR